MLNPIMYTAREPMQVRGEYFLLQRDGMHCSVTVPGLATLKSSGIIFLTTLRIVFVSTEHKKLDLGSGMSFDAFDFPITTLHKEKFNQPVFGANSLSGTVLPLEGMGLPGPATFKLTFNSGGCGSFLNFFLRALREIRSGTTNRAGGLGAMAGMGTLRTDTAAFVDPNDPTVVYISQPQVATSTVGAAAYGPLAQAVILQPAAVAAEAPVR
jgi:hypothetical protein